MTTAPAQAEPAPTPDIVVTGTLFRRTDTETASPVTVLTSADIEQRGITTMQGAHPDAGGNNGPALTNSFSANGAFAGGASSVSLRGLTTSSTLVLFDGLRAAYYPLADDGTRNFVDLNTIPDEIVDRVEVLRDGASVDLRRGRGRRRGQHHHQEEITGVHATCRGRRVRARRCRAISALSATVGYGDLDEQGFNAYISGIYLPEHALYNRDRGYPYNTDDQTGICDQGVCGAQRHRQRP